MRSLTRKTEYALAALAHMARDHDQRVRARELAERLGGSASLLMNVLKALTQHGLVQATRGPKGGYRLARLPTDVSLVEVIEAIEGPMRLAECCRPGPVKGGNPCGLQNGCSIRGPLLVVHDGLCAFLSQVTLAHIAFDRVPARVEQGKLPRGAAIGGLQVNKKGSRRASR